MIIGAVGFILLLIFTALFLTTEFDGRNKIKEVLGFLLALVLLITWMLFFIFAITFVCG